MVRLMMVASLLLFSAVGEAQDFCRVGGPTKEVWIPGLRGSRASLVRQNARADAEGLIRIANDRELIRMQRSGELVRVPETHYLREKPDPRWSKKFRWLRPNAATLLDDTAAMVYAIFGQPLQWNSGVRTKERQRGIIRAGNYNAAPVEGERASPHLTGAAFDIAKLPLTKEQREFLRLHLKDMERRGFLEVSEEFNQAVFHVMVFSTYPARTLGHPTEAHMSPAPQ